MAKNLRSAALLTALVLVVAAVYHFRSTHRRARRFQVTMNSPLNPVTSAGISPDGRMLAYSDNEGVHIKNLTSGDTSILMPPQPDAHLSWNVSGWFPDNTRFLLNATAPDGKQSLWIGATSGIPHLLVEDAMGWSMSPDGSLVAFTRRDKQDAQDEVWMIDPDGGHQHKAFDTPGNNYLTRVRWSPDGRWLAYFERPADPLQFSAKLQIHGPKAASPITLVSDPGLMDFFWLPDGRIVYSIGGERACEFEVIRTNPATGAPQGKPQKIARLAGTCMHSATVTRSGDRIAFIDGPIKSTVSTMNLDTAGLPTSPPKRLTTSQGADSPGSWLPDNKTVVFQSTRTGQADLYSQAGATEAPIRLTSEPGDKYWPRVTSDGAWVVYQVLPHVFPKGSTVVTYSLPRPLVRVPSTGGAPQRILEESLLLSHRCARKLDLCMVSQVNSSKDHLVFSAVDFGNGKLRELTIFPIEAGGNYSWDISGDGTRIAIAKAGDPQIQILSVAEGTVQRIPIPGWVRHQGLDWASDDRGLFIGTATPEGTALLHVNLEGKLRTIWRQQDGVRSSGIESPDGAHLSLLGWVRQGNVWLIENH